MQGPGSRVWGPGSWVQGAGFEDDSAAHVVHVPPPCICTVIPAADEDIRQKSLAGGDDVGAGDMNPLSPLVRLKNEPVTPNAHG